MECNSNVCSYFSDDPIVYSQELGQITNSDSSHSCDRSVLTLSDDTVQIKMSQRGFPLRNDNPNISENVI